MANLGLPEQYLCTVVVVKHVYGTSHEHDCNVVWLLITRTPYFMDLVITTIMGRSGSLCACRLSGTSCVIIYPDLNRHSE